MTASNCLFLIATAFAVFGWEVAVMADDDVTVVPAPTTAPAPAKQQTTADGSPVVHKSLHKKHPTATASTTASPPATAPATNPPVYTKQTVVVGPAAINALPASAQVVPLSQWQPAPATTYSRVAPPTPAAPVKITTSTVSIPVPTATSTVHTPDLSPAVETGLPVAKYSGINTPIQGVSTYMPTPVPMPVKPVTGATTHQPYYASILPPSVIPLTSSATSSYYAPPSRTTAPPPDFVFTNFNKKPSRTYPWKTHIITTMFWIGEGGSSISATDNIGSAWDENWRTTNRGSDNPDDRNGYASADHASTVNPFYVALPFNDLAYPDKARDWVPRSWHRPNEDGKQVSACKDRWVCIKNVDGRVCYAQWEDVGPLRSDHAEYVFGSELPDTYTRAGLDVSPAVAKYLDIDGNRRAITSWKFVDDADVPPGQWLKYDEQAVIFTAMHQFRSAGASDLPIQKASEPIDDQNNAESNKKRLDQSKG